MKYNIDFFEKTPVQTLIKLKEECDDIYYNTGQNPKLTDSEYDRLCEYLEQNNRQTEVGTKIRDIDNKINLPIWMGSMDKICYDKDVERKLNLWKKKNVSNKPIIIEEKLDGVSCLLIYNQNEVKLYTRGNGKIGTDISYLKSYIKNIPLSIPKNISIRGELIISKDVFDKKYKTKFANARNLVSGCVNAKTIKDGTMDIEFITYEIITEHNSLTPSYQLKLLSDYGFKVVVNKIISVLNPETLKEQLIYLKNSSNYEIDGVIVQYDTTYKRNVNGNPSYAFAFKMTSTTNIKETIVEEVLWNVSKWGYIKPKLKVKSVEVGGIIISYVSAHNAKFILDNQIGKNTIINITRSGDVIPYIVNIVFPTQPDLPVDIDYDWNETNTDIITKDITEEQKIKHILNFFQSMNVKHLGEQNIRKIYNSGFDTIQKILNITVSELENIDTFKSKMAENIYNSIHTYINENDIVSLLSAGGVFGFGLGEKKIQLIFDEIPDIFELDEITLTTRLLDIKGLSTKSVNKIISNINNARSFYQTMKPYIDVKKEVNDTPIVHKEYIGQNIVFSGFRDKELEKIIKSNGGTVSKSVTRKTTLLLVKSDNQTDKYTKAKEYGIEIKQI